MQPKLTVSHRPWQAPSKSGAKLEQNKNEEYRVEHAKAGSNVRLWLGSGTTRRGGYKLVVKTGEPLKQQAALHGVGIIPESLLTRKNEVIRKAAGIPLWTDVCGAGRTRMRGWSRRVMIRETITGAEDGVQGGAY